MTWAVPGAAFCLGIGLYILLRDWDEWGQLPAGRKAIVVVAVLNGIIVGVAVAVALMRQAP